MSSPPRRILVAPLDWGLGHASRCIPIIQTLLHMEVEVILAGNGRSLALLTDHFPELLSIQLPDYRIRYARTARGFIGNLFRQIPRILWAIRQEHQQLAEILSQYEIKGIISDNRYGVWNPHIPSVVICHQLCVRLPSPFQFLRKPIFQLHQRFLAKFEAVWIPDYPSRGMAEDLIHSYPTHLTTHFLGPLSRFYEPAPTSPHAHPLLSSTKVDIVVVLSGPEPQRSLIEERIRAESQHISREVCIIQGKPELQIVEKRENLTTISYLGTEDLRNILLRASVVISRSGYSSLMDYEALGLSQVILVPTPGQTEQLYLAARMQELGKALHISQRNFSLTHALDQVKQYQGFARSSSTTYLNPVLQAFLHRIPS